MSQSKLLQSFLDPGAPKHMRLVAARGLAPLPQSESLELLVHLQSDPDTDISSQAGVTLQSWPVEDIVTNVSLPECSAEVLGHFASVSPAPPVLEAIIANPATPNQIIELLALSTMPELLERILDNRVRLLQSPDILRNLKLNPSVTPLIGRLVHEIETEFFGTKKSSYTLEEPTEPPRILEPPPGIEAEPLPGDLSLEGLPQDPEEREAALLTRISKLSVRQKIQQALMGPREARAILIRDANKEVARTVLHSPKLSDNEVETFAAMRNVSEDILRDIGNSKEWTRSYTVVQNLVKNPKTPPMISQRMMFRLLSRDLTLLARDRGVPEAVRRSAERTLSQRTTSKSQ